MRIDREISFDGRSYNYSITDDNKKLSIVYGGNYDLYLSVNDGKILPDNRTKNIYFDITKENYQLYEAFDKMYNDIIDGFPFGRTEYGMTSNYRYRYEYSRLVKNNNKIVWISDENAEDVADKLTIIKKDEDTYRLTFTRNNKPLLYGTKSLFNISVRICNSGSKYDPFNCSFMQMFQDLQKIESNDNQIHFENVEYIKKLEKKK